MSNEQTTGAITLRSNVVVERNRWDLVPGELLYELRRIRNASRLQREEHMYYQPCSICDRTIAEINLTGCIRCTYAPTPSAVLGAQEAHRRRVAEARRREAEENARIGAAISVRAAGILHSAGDAADAEIDQPLSFPRIPPIPSDTPAQ